HPDRSLAQQMRDASRGIAPAAIDQPFVTDRFVALDQAPEEALQLRVRLDDLVEVLGLADHHLAADDRLDAIFGAPFTREDALAGKAQRYDLSPARIVALELGDDARTDEHHFVARRSGFAEWATRIDLDRPVLHLG